MEKLNEFICDGEFQIVRIKENLYDQVTELYKNYFMKYENISIVANLMGNQETTNEMIMLLHAILNDGLSFAAIHVKTNRLAAIACNKILNPSTNCSVDDVFQNCHTAQMLHVGNTLNDMETEHNIFEEWNIDCIMELFFLSTHPDFERNGLASILSEYSIEFARQLKNSTLPATILNELPEHIRCEKPKAVTSLFTSYFTQRLGEKLHFETINKKSFKDFHYNGQSYAERLDPIHQVMVYAARKL